MKTYNDPMDDRTHRRRLRFSRWLALALVFLLTRHAPAQEGLLFKPSRHLKAYEDCRASDYGILYRFDAFEALEGERLDMERLRELQARWEEEMQRVAKEIRRIEEDPRVREAFLLEKRLHYHPYFSKIALTRMATPSSPFLFIQPPQKPRKDHEKMLLDLYAPCLTKLTHRFQEVFAGPLGLQRREGRCLDKVVILASYGDYSNYWRTCFDRGPMTGRAHYHEDLGITVTYWDAVQSPEDAACRGAALWGVTHGLLHAHCNGSEMPKGLFWLREGLSRYFAAVFRDGDGPVEDEGFDRDGLKELALMVRRPDEREAFFIPLGELLSVTSQNDLIRKAEPRAGAVAKRNRLWGNQAISCYQVEAGLFTWFLLHHEDGARRGAFLDALKTFCAGKGESDPALDGADLHDAFIRFLAQSLQQREPRLAFNPVLLDLLHKAGERPEPAAKSRSRPFPDPAFQPAVLSQWKVEEDQVLARALYQAVRGRIQEGLSEMEAQLATGTISKACRHRLERERQRLGSLEALRRSVLESLRDEKKRIRIAHEGTTHRGLVAAVEATSLLLRDSRGREVSLPLAAFDLAWLAQCIRERRVEIEADWLQAYLALLLGSGTWSRRSQGDDPETARLREDEGAIRDALQTGEVLCNLQDLARTPLPVGAEEGRILLDKIRVLYADHRERPVVRQQKENLRQFAAHGCGQIFDRLDLQDVFSLSGTLETLPDGAVRLSYDFDDPSQLDDFAAVDYLDEIRKDLPPVRTAREDAFFRISEGALRCRGMGCRRLDFLLKAPLLVSYRLVFESGGLETLPAGWFVVGFCDDRYGSCIKAIETGSLEAFHKRSAFYESDFPEGFYVGDTTYHIEIRHDGERVESRMDGRPFAAVSSGPLQSGGIFLWVHHDLTIRLERLVVEGRPDPANRERLRQEWIKRETAFFDEE